MLPGPGYAAADFSRLTGIRPDVLRKYRERGVFAPSSTDPRGRLRYGADQLGPGRLLAALVGSGMSASRAAAVVASQDRDAVEEHLVAVQGLIGQAREHLPVRGGAWRCWVERTAVEVVPLPERTTAEQLVACARAAQRDLAARLACGVDEPPRWESDAELLAGPAVSVLHGADGAPADLRALLLPLPPGPAPAGRPPAEERGSWTMTGTPAGLLEALDVGGPKALLGRGGVLDELVGSASRRGWGVPGPVRLLLSADLCSASPLLRLL